MRRHAANLVSALRLLLTPPFVVVVCAGSGSPYAWIAAVLFTVIAVSDFVDGRIARALGTMSNRGRMVDHGSDIIFVLSAFGAYVVTGAAPWWVPAAIAVAFAAYVIESWRFSGPPRGHPLGNRLGHAGGVLNWIVIGVLVGNDTLALGVLGPAFVRVLFYLVLICAVLPILIRVLPMNELTPRQADPPSPRAGG